MNGLLKIKEDLTKEREEHLKEIAKLQEAAENSNSIQSKIEGEKQKLDEKIQEVRDITKHLHFFKGMLCL